MGGKEKEKERKTKEREKERKRKGERDRQTVRAGNTEEAAGWVLAPDEGACEAA